MRTAPGLVTIDGSAAAPPVPVVDGLRLLGLDGGIGNSCITNVGSGPVHVSHPDGRVAGGTRVADTPLEMRVDGGVGNVAVTNIGTGAVTVRRDGVRPAPVEVAEPAGEMPRLELDAGHDGVFVTNIGTGAVTVVDRAHVTEPLPEEVPLPPEVVVHDPITGNVYVTNLFGPAVTVVDRGGPVSRTVEEPDPVTRFDHGTGNVFVTNIGAGSVVVVRD